MQWEHDHNLHKTLTKIKSEWLSAKNNNKQEDEKQNPWHA